MPKISNLFTESFPGEKEYNNTPRLLKEAFYAFTTPTQPKSPSLIHINAQLINELGLNNYSNERLLELLSGKTAFKGFATYAMNYAGHQFGNWAGQLGDGRAMVVAEVNTGDKRNVIQLKGAGPTPFSRRGDGYAVLRSSIREYLCSEAMFHLGVPTTRALSLCTTGDQIVRDMLYDGHPEYEKGAITSRVASNFIRFGNFEFFAAQKDVKSLTLLTNYCIQHFFPHIPTTKEGYALLFDTIVSETKELILHWYRVGFIHGVMNTDNMSITSNTIDYGPYGWIDNYDPNFTPNTTDKENKRYRFANQHQIALWNLNQLANAFYQLTENIEPLRNSLENYRDSFLFDWLKQDLQKIGITSFQKTDNKLIAELKSLLETSQIDFTLFYRELTHFEDSDITTHTQIIQSISYLSPEQFSSHIPKWNKWLNTYKNRLLEEDTSHEDRQILMKKINPKYILRNYMSQMAIDQAENDNFDLINELFELIQHPYSEQLPFEKNWYQKRPDWAENKIGCSMLSCSS